MKDKTVKRSGKKIAVIALVSLLALLILAAFLFFGISSCTNKGGQIDQPTEGVTVRKAAPTDGSKPTDHSALDNVAYMAYVLDNQPSYHAYANNSTRSTGYEQITQTWKDYKSADLSGIGQSVMVCSDLSYSMLVKASTQTCFVGSNDAYMRTGAKPAGKSTTPTEVSWNAGQPDYYAKDAYRTVYGDFSTELTVYVINEDTFEGADGVIDNGDGTYSQKFYLKPEAAFWYQYGMKTRGSLKLFPEFKKIEITFTFDSSWQVLSTYCEENTRIAPSALGGVPMDSVAKTTTTFDYSQQAFDNSNYSYFENYYKNYLGSVNPGTPSGPEEEQPTLIDVLGSAFSKVVDPAGSGQQFALELTLGDTKYIGKAYAKLGDMGDILGTLDIRLALGREDGGNQDLFVQFSDGAVKVYYSDGFALNADISKVSAAVGRFSDWINSFDGELEAQTVAYALTEEGADELDLDSLLEAINFTYTDTSANISIVSDDLLGLGLGINLQLNADREKGENGSFYTFKNLSLGGVTYNSEQINLILALVPDESSEIISRDENSAYADLADYIDGVLNLLNSNTYYINLNLDGSSEIKYISGISAEACAQVKLIGGYKKIQVSLPVTVNYKDLSLQLEAFYEINLENGDFGTVYLSVKNFCGKDVEAKVYCDISEVTSAVTRLIDFFKVEEAEALSDNAEALPEQTNNTVASVINTILNLDYAKLIKELKADEKNISVSVDVDEILTALNVELGVKLGGLNLSLGLENNVASLSGNLPELGLNVTVNGSKDDILVPETSGYADVTTYINGVYNLLNSNTYLVNLSLDYGAKAEVNAQVKLSKDFKNIQVNAPITVSYENLTLDIEVYYEINLESGNYGNVYVNVKNFCGKDVSAKVYCDISETVEAVKQLIAYFGFSEAQTYSEEEVDKVANVLEKVLNIDYAAVINELTANADKVELEVNADKLLEGLGLDLGVSLGAVKVELGIDEAKRATLEVNLPEYELSVNLSGSEKDITVPDSAEYADITAYVNGVYNLLNSNTYLVNLSLDYGAKAEVNAQVKLSKDFKNIQVNAPITVSYEELSLDIEVYYEINLESGNYGNVYVFVKNFCGKDVSAKVYCDISETVEAVKQLIAYFGSSEAQAYTDEEVDKVASVLEIVFNIDYAAVINELTANADKVELEVNADKLLEGLGLDLGVSLGAVKVELGIDEAKRATLEVNLPEYELSVNLSGSDSELEFDKNGYADITAYVNGVYNLLNSNAYLVNLSLDYGAKAEVNAQVKLGKDFKNIQVNAPVFVSYEELSLDIEVYYEINLESGNYGNVYVNVKNFCGKDVSAKVYCDISETVEAVKQLIEYFGSSEAQAYTDEEVDKVANVLEIVFNIDYAAVINELTANADKVELEVNADKLLEGLGLDLGVSLGAVKVELGIDEAKRATLEVNLPEYELSVNLSGSDKDITVPDSAEYADITAYVNAVYNLIDSATYILDLSLDGTCGIQYLNGVTLDTSVRVKLRENYRSITVDLPISLKYNDFSVLLDAHYEINLESGDFGKVYLNLTKIGSRLVDVKVYCDVSEAKDAVTKLINYFGSESVSAVQTYSGEEVEKAANIIDILLNIDYAAIINEFTADGTGIKLSVNADEILGYAGVDLGVSLGTVELELSIDDNEKAVLGGSLSELGLKFTVWGSDYDRVFLPFGYADLTAYVNAVYEFIDGNTYLVDIALDGSADFEYINGVEVYATAQIEVNDSFSQIAVQIPELTVCYKGLCVVFDLYYSIDLENNDYGSAYLNLVSVNGNALGAKVRCNIKDTADAIVSLIDLINATDSVSTLSYTDEEVEKVVNVINLVTQIDYAQLIIALKADNKAINLTVDADKVLELFALELGVEIGNVSLELSIDENNKVVLGGKIPAFGLALNISGDDNGIVIPDDEEYLNLAELIELVTAATVEAKKIIQCQDILFNVDAALTVDGVKMTVAGIGEVVWKDDSIRVAADLEFSIAEKENSEKVEVKLLYDETQETLVRFTVNGLGLEISKTDIADTQSGLNEIIQSINGLVGGISGASAAAYSLNETEVEENGNEQAVDFAKILNAVINAVSEVTVRLQNSDIDGAEVKDLLITYAMCGSLKLSSNGNLALSLGVNNNNGTEILNVNASVTAGDGENIASLNEQFEEVNFYKSSDEKTFIRAVYEYLFDMLDGLSVKDLLGDGTYCVAVNLNGSESGIAALDGINVNANLYYSETDDGEKLSKLVEAELNLDINGTAVIANAYFADRDLYIQLNQIGNTLLEDIAFKASTEDIYSAADTLVKIITSDVIASIIESLSNQPAPAALSLDGENTASTLTGVINYLLTLNIEEVIVFSSVSAGDDRINSLTVNPDGLLQALGVDISIGTVTVEVNPVTHAVYASVANGQTAWVTFNAKVLENGERDKFNPESGYIDIGFVSNLLDDILVTLNGMKTEPEIGDGENVEEQPAEEVDVRLSLTGNLKVNLVSIKDVEIKDLTLTVGFDEDNEFYFSLHGNLQDSTINILVKKYVLAKASTVSVTYSKGCITFGRDVDSANPKYKVVTLAYLLDNLLDKNNSPIFWWLGSENIEGILGLIPEISGLGSDLMATEDYYLYDNTQTPEVPETNTVKLSDYVLGFMAKLDGYSSAYGSDIAGEIKSKFGLTDNYYAANVDVSSLIGDTLRNIYAAIVRNENGGIKGLDAYAQVYSGSTAVLSITAMLDGGLTKAHAQNYFKTVTQNYEIDFGHYDVTSEVITEIFGCFTTGSNASGTYDYSQMLSRKTLTVVGVDGKVQTADLKFGSTVYVKPDNGTVWLDDEHKLIYTFEEDGIDDIGASFKITQDTVIYARAVKVYNVTFHAAEGRTFEFVLGEGELLPDYEVDGYIFAGWFADEALNGESVSTYSLDYGTDIYGRYESRFVTLSNGVTYELVKDGGELYYKVTGFTNLYDGSTDYSSAENTLILANKIGAFAVKEIGESAFDGESVANVIVSENVKTIGAKAFANNKNLASVVLLAPEVYLCGKTDKDSTNTVFIGCDSSLQVYLNSYSAEDASNCFCYGYSKDWLSRYTYNNLGGVHRGGWAYVNFDIKGENADSYTRLADGINTVAISNDEIKAYINGLLNEACADYGYINAYDINIDCDYDGVELNGCMYTVSITVNRNDASEWWYAFSLENTVGVCSAQYTVNSENHTILNGVEYVQAGASIALTATSDETGVYVFVGWEGIQAEGAQAIATMPASVTAVKTVWEANYAKNIYVSSEVAFTYGDESYAAGKAVKLENAAIGLNLADLKAEGYKFLGWAVADGESLNVQSSIAVIDSDDEVTYYALWAVAREDLQFVLDGSQLTASVKDGYDGSFYGWYNYTDETFSQLLSRDAITLSTSLTVVRARISYSLTVNLNASNTIWGYTMSSSNDVSDTMSCKYSLFNYKFSGGTQLDNNNAKLKIEQILEGYQVNVHRFYDDGITVRILDEKGQNVATYLFKGYSNNDRKGNGRKQFVTNNDASNPTGVAFTDEWKVNTEAGITLVNGLYCKSYDGNDVNIVNHEMLFASVSSVSGNLSFTSKV